MLLNYLIVLYDEATLDFNPLVRASFVREVSCLGIRSSSIPLLYQTVSSDSLGTLKNVACLL